MSTTSGSIRNFIPMQNKYDRVILLVDMDCFYCQVEEKLNPELKGQPLAVVQYNAWRGGGIIAVNYAARAKGVTRHMRGDEAKEQCPEIRLVQVPNVREKADLSKYRDAGKDVANVLQRFTTLLERASVDEAYLDITEAVNKRLEEINAGTFVLQPQELISTFAVGYDRIGDYLKVISAHFANPYASDDHLNMVYAAADVPAVRQSDVKLLLGASIASEIRAEVKKITSFECSAGIAHNKILAKLACGMNKPNKQTILPLSQVEKLFETLPISKIKGLGAKFGEEVCERLKIRYLGQMLKYTETELQKMFDEKNGSWLYYICRGIDLEAVTPRFYSKSIGCCKKFPGRNNITGMNTLKHWLKELATEIAERLEKDISENNRKAKQMTVSYIQEFDNEEISSSRSVALLATDIESLTQRSFDVIKANTKQFLRPGSDGVLNNPIKFLGISVGKFETVSNNQGKLQEMFANQAKSRKRKSDTIADIDTDTDINTNINTNTDANNDGKCVESEKPSSSSSSKKHRDEDKMKGFFAKYLQQEKSIKTANVEEIKEDEKPSNEPKEIESFFIKALRNQNAEIMKPIEVEQKSPNLYRKMNEIENDEILQLTAELNAIASEDISDDSNQNGNLPKKQRQSNNSVSEDNENTINTDSASCNYENQYAEYAVPQLRLDLLEFQRCDICGAKIPVEERALQLHRDHHFAQQLSQQQREEFRTQVKSKVVKNQPNTTQQQKKKTSKSNSTSISAKASIATFLKSKSNQSPSSNEIAVPQASTSAQALQQVAAEDVLPCSECKALIKRSAIEEHKDYHLAKKIQQELNKLEVQTVVIPKKSSSSTSNKKLNKTLNGKKNSQDPTSATFKPITEFFTQSQFPS